MLWAWLSRSWRGWRSAHSHRQAGNRPRVAPARLSPVLDMEEPTSHRPPGGAARCPRVDSRDVDRESRCGARRGFTGSCRSSGISVSESTVAKYMRRHPRPPSQTWRTFLANHASQIMAADLFVVPTVTFRLLFVLVILAHDRRRIVHVAVTAHPTAAWTAQQLRNAFPENEAPRYLLHDRDSVFAHVATTLEGMNIQEVRTAPRSPWQNALRGARHRLDPTRVPRSRDRGERGGASPSAHGLRRVLHALANTSRARQGHAESRARSHRRRPVALSPFQKSAVCITVTTASRHNHGRRVAEYQTSRDCPVLWSRCALTLTIHRHPHSCGWTLWYSWTGLTIVAEHSNGPDMTPYRLLDNHSLALERTIGRTVCGRPSPARVRAPRSRRRGLCRSGGAAPA